MMRLRAGVASDRGLIRPANEDSFFLRRSLYAVCDGMGGARAGEVASQMACLGLLALNPASAAKKDLRMAVVNTNQAIISRSLSEDHLLGMGTTLTAVLIREGSLILAHVGDSRAYLFHDGSLIQLTEDHSWVGEMVRRGELTPDQAAVHPHRSVITRALGTDGDLEPDMDEIDIGEGDRVVLCSDGLSGFVSEADIAALLGRGELPQTTAELLVKAALATGGEDNVTVVVVDVVAGDDRSGESDPGDQVGERMLIGPSDRGELQPATRGKKASAAVRERLGRRAAPTVRPVGPRPSGGMQAAETAPTIEETQTTEEASAEGDLAEEEPPVIITPAPVGDAPTGEAPTRGSPAQESVVVEAAPRKRSRRRWIFLVVAIVLVLAIAAAGFAIFNSTVYYVGPYDGAVALYRGLPGTFLGIDLSSVIQLGTIDYQALAPYLQERVDAKELIGKEEGRAFLESLGVQQ
jgi:serine/threonine protein phosphatase PrpC